MAKCFDGLVGISRKESNPCFPAIPADYKKSKFNLFLDELEGGITLDSIQSALDDPSYLIEKFKVAISGAQNFFKADLLADLAMRYKTASEPFMGIVGNRSFARTRQMASQWAGMKLKVKPKIGAYLSISKIYLYMDQTVEEIPFEIAKLRKLHDGTYVEELVKALTLSSVANSEKENNLSEPITLPLFELDGTTADYYLLYDRSAGFLPKDNAARCNCGRSELRLFQYLEAAGVEGNRNTPQDMSTAIVSNGIVLQAEAKCGTDDVICDAMEINEAVGMITAYAQWYKAGEILIDAILASSEINRYTTANRDFLYSRKNKFNQEYHARIRWIGENINLSGTDCYACDEDKGIALKGILA